MLKWKLLSLAILFAILGTEVATGSVNSGENYEDSPLPWVDVFLKMEDIEDFSKKPSDLMLTWLQEEKNIEVFVLDTRQPEWQSFDPMPINLLLENKWTPAKSKLQPREGENVKNFLARLKKDPHLVQGVVARTARMWDWMKTLEAGERAGQGGVYLAANRGVIGHSLERPNGSRTIISGSATPQGGRDLFLIRDSFSQSKPNPQADGNAQNKFIWELTSTSPTWKTRVDWIRLYVQYLMKEAGIENEDEGLDKLETRRLEAWSAFEAAVPKPSDKELDEEKEVISFDIKPEGMMPELIQAYQAFLDFIRYHLLIGAQSYGVEMATVQVIWSLRDRLGTPADPLGKDKPALRFLLAHWEHNFALYKERIWGTLLRHRLTHRFLKTRFEDVPQPMRQRFQETIQGAFKKADAAGVAANQWINEAKKELETLP